MNKNVNILYARDREKSFLMQCEPITCKSLMEYTESKVANCHRK